MTFTQALSTRTLHRMIAHAIGITLGLATYALEGGKLDNGKLPATGFDYVATSGEEKPVRG
jgi:hypothetical protein